MPDHPSLSRLPDIGQALEQAQVQHLSSEAGLNRPMKALKGRLAGLDAIDADIVRPTPVRENPSQKLGDVVDPQRLGRPPMRRAVS